MTKQQRTAVKWLSAWCNKYGTNSTPTIFGQNLLTILNMLAETEDERVMVVKVPRPNSSRPSQCTIYKSCDYTHSVDILVGGFFKAQRLACTPGPGCPWHEEKK